VRRVYIYSWQCRVVRAYQVQGLLFFNMLRYMIQSVLGQLQLDVHARRVGPQDVQLGPVINRGPTATVFMGTCRGSPVAIKQLHLQQAGGQSEGLTTNQLREIEVIRGLNHLGIQQIIDHESPT
jgi:hypothetical protein